MWILFSLLCMLSLTASDIIGKKAIEKDKLAPEKLRVMVMACSVVTGILMFVLGLGESGLSPWMLLWKHPMILISELCIIFSEYLYVVSLRYIGLSVMETISGLEGVTIFAGLFLMNIISGKLSAVREMLLPGRFILICIILVFTIILPNTDRITKKKAENLKAGSKKKHVIIIGIFLAFSAVIIGTGDSLINDFILNAGSVGTADYIMCAYFAAIVPLPFFCIYLFVKGKNSNASCKIISRYTLGYTVFYLANIFLGLFAVSSDAVRTEIMFMLYPVISILGAKIILKEKYSLLQNVCIWVITLAGIAFCVVDYIV